MSRTTSTTANLHGYSIEELKVLRRTYPSEYGRNILTAVIMLTEGSSVREIADFLAQTIMNIYIYINRWNEFGQEVLISKRGKSSNSRITAEMETDILNTVKYTKPNDFGLLGHNWTAQLLADYVKENYDEYVCAQTIRNLLHRHNFSFKRAQKRPSKGVKSEQEAFKKNDNFDVICRKRF